MHSAIFDMLEKYKCQTVNDYKNALKEIIQEIALLGLFRSNFFTKAAFYGGTALRMLYALDRFSEDIDFSLLKQDPAFEISLYFKTVLDELHSFGFDVEVSKKQKQTMTAIESAFIKGGTQIHLLKIGVPNDIADLVQSNELLKIKLEIDTSPPESIETEVKYLLNPVPYHVRVFTLPCLLAGKIHALTCRPWKNNRIKGRDLYDYVWFLSKEIPVHVQHLQARMRQTEHLDPQETLTPEMIHQLLYNKFNTIDYNQARHDVDVFLKDTKKTLLWSPDFFNAISNDQLRFIS